MYIVLLTSGLDLPEAIGPFASKTEAHDWARRNLPYDEDFDIIEVQAPHE